MAKRGRATSAGYLEPRDGVEQGDVDAGELLEEEEEEEYQHRLPSRRLEEPSKLGGHAAVLALPLLAQLDLVLLRDRGELRVRRAHFTVLRVVLVQPKGGTFRRG